MWVGHLTEVTPNLLPHNYLASLKTGEIKKEWEWANVTPSHPGRTTTCTYTHAQYVHTQLPTHAHTPGQVGHVPPTASKARDEAPQQFSE